MRILTLLCSLFFATPLFAHEYTAGDITIKHPMSPATTGKTSAGYMMISNTSAVADRLIAAEADFPRVEMHNTIVTDGVAKMQKQTAIEIPAGGQAQFAPGGLHIMFMGLSQHLMDGDSIPATLVFENAGRVDITFHVKPRAYIADHMDMDHSSHDHSGENKHSCHHDH